MDPDHKQKFNRYILRQVSKKYRCAECNQNYLDIKEIEFENDVTAKVILGCCEARFEETIIFEDYFPD